jgi:hypothetical protein
MVFNICVPEGATETRTAVQRDLEAREGCNLYTLAKSNVAHVQCCSHCGALSLHLGPITLRFDAAALESLWNVIGQALMHAHDDAEREPLRPLRMQRAGRA